MESIRADAATITAWAEGKTVAEIDAAVNGEGGGPVADIAKDIKVSSRQDCDARARRAGGDRLSLTKRNCPPCMRSIYSLGGRILALLAIFRSRTHQDYGECQQGD